MAAVQRTPEDIRASIEANRTALAHSLESLRSEVTQLTDWRAQLAAHRKQVVIGAAGGVFAIFGLVILLHGFAWLAYYVIPFPDGQYFWGFFVIAGLLFLLGGLAAFLAYKAFKAASPPTPQMAIDEAQLIKETVKSPNPETTIGGVR